MIKKDLLPFTKSATFVYTLASIFLPVFSHRTCIDIITLNDTYVQSFFSNTHFKYVNVKDDNEHKCTLNQPLVRDINTTLTLTCFYFNICNNCVTLTSRCDLWKDSKKDHINFNFSLHT